MVLGKLLRFFGGLRLGGDWVLKQEGYDFMGAAFEVYNVLGHGMAEEIYQQSLEIELGLRNIPFVSKADLPVRYKSQRLTTLYRPDLLVYGDIVVELKAVKALAAEHEAQLFNYLRISFKAVGYLINYGVSSGLEWKRLILSSRECGKAIEYSHPKRVNAPRGCK